MKAVVTGAAGGIGRAIVVALQTAGWEVGGLDLPVDVTDYGQVYRFFARQGQINALINGAGICQQKDFDAQSYEEYSQIVQVNLLGLMNCCHAAIPHLAGGDIVNIASRSGAYGHPGLAAYCASKAGVMGFSEALALDLRELGIRVAYLMPGTVATGLGGIHEPDDRQIAPENVAEAVLDILMMQRRTSFGRVELKPSFPK